MNPLFQRRLTKLNYHGRGKKRKEKKTDTVKINLAFCSDLILV